jgi:DNA processing protein
MTGPAAASGFTGAREPIRLTAAQLPACLGDIPYPPAGLWCLGDPRVLEQAPEGFVAIVGTREASPYGERIATRLATAAVRAGLVVVSGLARGIDAAAHRGAIAARGRTVAVLGTGVDVPYPSSHRTLHGQVLDNGAVLSEMELGTRAFPGCFPRRNRIIAGLAQVTVVVEAGFKSGAINTASQAIDQGRVVAVVPGQMDDPRAAGSNQLIRDGAQVIASVDDLLMLCGKAGVSVDADSRAGVSALAVGAGLGQEDRAILKLLGPSPTPSHEVAFATGMSVRQVSEALLRLELAGFAEGGAGGYRRRAG